MVSIDRLPVFMQHEVIELLKRAGERNAEVYDVAAWQWWILTNVVNARAITRDKTEGETLIFEGFRFHKLPPPTPAPGSRADLSDPTIYEP
jgi:hypothetical protein